MTSTTAMARPPKPKRRGTASPPCPAAHSTQRAKSGPRGSVAAAPSRSRAMLKPSEEAETQGHATASAIAPRQGLALQAGGEVGRFWLQTVGHASRFGLLLQRRRGGAGDQGLHQETR